LLAAAAFAVSLLLQVPVQVQYLGTPFAETPISDAQSYHEWGLRIAAEGISSEPVFHQAPGFPVFLGVVYDAGGGPQTVPWIQMVLVAFAVALLVPIGRLHLGSARAGAAAAAAGALYAPLAFHALKLLPVALAVATQALAVLMLGLLRSRPRAVPCLALGAAAGLAAVVRAEFLLFAPVAALAAWTAPGEPSRMRRAAHVACVLAGLAILIVPVALHNRNRGAAVLVASSGGENLFIGNRRGAKGDFTALHPQAGDVFSARRLARELAQRDLGGDPDPAEVSAYWRNRAIREVLSDPGGWLVLETRKLLRVFHPGDPTDMYSLPLERREYLPALYAFALPSGFVLAAGVVGAWFVGRRWRRTWPLLAWPALHLAVLLAFFVSERLRLPFLFAALPLAGAACDELLAALRLPRRRGRAWLGIATAVGWIASRPTPRDVVRLAAVLSSRGELDSSLRVLQPVVAGPDADALALDQAGWVLQKMGRLREAADRYRQALAAGIPSGRSAQTHTRLAGVLERLGNVSEAAREHDAAVAAERPNAGTFYERGMFRLRRGDTEGAIRDLREAVRRDPGWPPPREALASLSR
jgi:tetratricopeptide (TPR) repeat protein